MRLGKSSYYLLDLEPILQNFLVIPGDYLITFYHFKKQNQKGGGGLRFFLEKLDNNPSSFFFKIKKKQYVNNF